MLLFLGLSIWAHSVKNYGPISFLQIFEAIKELGILWFIGALITTIFGVPILLLLDKLFARFSLRYMIGGAFASWIAWLFIAGPLFTPHVWHNPRNWIGWGLGHVSIYVGVGFATGALLTVAIWWIERRSS